MNTQATKPATVLTSMRLPAELKSWLQHQAIDNRRSLPGEVIFRLEESRQRQMTSQSGKAAS
jgi:hypothetical protein